MPEPRRGAGTGRSFFLTGVTGFLGKVLLEEIFRRREELRLERVYVLIRSRGSRHAEERFRREVAASPCFGELPEGWAQDVVVVEGVLERPGLGLDAALRDELSARVTHVLHAAASVKFDLPLEQAARSNVTTSLNLLELARGFVRLERMVSLSTAYVTPHPGRGVPIRETLAALPAPAATIYDSILRGEADESVLLAQSGHPNTYTLTKSLAEHLLLERRGDVPLSIIRPSIISASWRHPFPGWIDSPAGFGSFVVLLGLGQLRVVVGAPDARLDLIPVDEVARWVLDECAVEAPPSPGPILRHAVAGVARSARIQECWRTIQDFFQDHRVDRRPVIGYLGQRGLRFGLADLVHHRLAPAAAALRSAGRLRSARQMRARIAHLNRVFPYFTSRSFEFESSVTVDPSFEAPAYVRAVCRGVYRHLLRRDETEWALAGRLHPGHGGDLRWSLGQPHGNAWIRFASWVMTKVLRRTVTRVTVDIPSFEAARRAARDGSPLVLVPNHRSYFDFVLCSYLCFARPDLGIAIPHIAATIEFGRIPILGRILAAMHAFYLRRGEGREDPELTRRVHALINEGRTLEFFIEGQRSRTRAFLPPKRGLLRCLQATGKSCTLLPIAFSYDRVPEEAAFAAELAGAPKSGMRLGPLLAWALKAWRGRIDLGRVHIACGAPVQLDRESDVHDVSHTVIQRLREATVSTTYHLRAFLHRHPTEDVDAVWLRNTVRELGGRVIESDLTPPDDLDPLIAATLRYQFAHLFEGNGGCDERLTRFRATLFGRDHAGRREREPVG
jgi:fatty acyl-CoA reductase